LSAGLPHVRSGAVRPLAVTGTRRHRLLPDVPTFKEAGYANFEGVTWYGIVGPARLPPAIVLRLNDEINRMLAQPDFRDQLSSEALDPMPMTPAQFGDYIASEIRHWTAVAQANHVSGE
jgi:tripartite-type tricarboxylate transporter receptor subunit TctC